MRVHSHCRGVLLAAVLTLALLISCALRVPFACAGESGAPSDSAPSAPAGSAAAASAEASSSAASTTHAASSSSDASVIPDASASPSASAAPTAPAAGLVSLDGKTYLFDEAGVQQAGWHKVGDEYRYFRHGEGDAGFMETDAVVNGIQLTESGIAVVTDEAREELEVLVKSQELCDEICDPGDTVEEKLERIYQWMLDDCEERGAEPFGDHEGWQRGYALDILDTHSGSCDSFGAGFAYLACAAGAEECAVVSSGGHTWAEVNGAVYDPEMGKQTASFRYFAFPYEQSGEDEGTPDYASHRVHVVQIAPRDETWGEVSETDIAAAEAQTGETGWVERAGKRLYVRDGVVLAAQWIDVDGVRYYLRDDGQPACGPALVDGVWRVFGEDGRLLSGEATRIEEFGGARYRVDAAGGAVSGWYTEGQPDGDVAGPAEAFGAQRASEDEDAPRQAYGAGGTERVGNSRQADAVGGSELTGGSRQADAAGERNPLARLFGLLVGIPRDEESDVDPDLRYSLEYGQVATGVCYSHDAIAAFTPEGVFDVARTRALQAPMDSGDAPALLAELGEPESVERSASCRPGFEGGFENTYTYPNIVVRTYNAPGAPDVLNYIEARVRVIEPDFGAEQDAPSALADAGVADGHSLSSLDKTTRDAVAAFTEEHGGDLRACFDVLSYREGKEGFIAYGDTGRSTVDAAFTNERIEQEARAAFVDHSAGNCYTFTVAFWCVSEQLGYEARPVVGTMVHEKSGKEYPTSWVEIRSGDTWSIYDPLHPDSLYGVPYGTYESIKRA